MSKRGSIPGLLLALALATQSANAGTQKNPGTVTHALDLVGHIGGLPTAYTAQGNHVYATTRTDFVVLEAANPTAVALTGQTGLTVSVQSLTAKDNLVVANAGVDGVRIFDVTKPAQPVLRDSLSSIGTVAGVKLTSTLALISTDTDMKIVDLAEAGVPKLVGRYPVTGELEVQGNLVFVANYNRIRILDITTPVSPSLVTDYVVANEQIELKDGLLYVWTNTPLPSLDGNFYIGQLRILDVSNPLNIREVYVSPDPYTYDGTFRLRPLSNIVLAEGHIYGIWSVPDRHGLSQNDVTSLDVKNVLSPTLSLVDLLSVYAGTHLGLGLVAIAGRRAYFSHGGILRIFDITTNLEIGRHQFWGARKVQVEHNVAYVAATNGVLTVDASTPTKPTLEGRLTLSQSLQSPFVLQSVDLSVYGPYVYAGFSAYEAQGFFPTLAVIDASNRSALKVITVTAGSYAYPSPITLTTRPQVIHNGYAYDFQLGPLTIYSLNDPESFLFNEIAQIPSTASYPKLAIVGNYAYVAGTYEGLHIINISNPQRPVSVKRLEGPLAVVKVVSAGQLLYVLTDQALKIYSLTDPENPVEISSTSLFTYGVYDFVGLKVDGHYVYIANSSALQVLDATNPNLPLSVVTSYSPANGGGFTSLDVVGNLVYLTSHYDGLLILRHNVNVPAQQTLHLPFVSNQPYLTPSQCNISYRTYERNLGWLGWVDDNSESGVVGQPARIEALQVKLCTDVPATLDIAFQAHVQNIGWMDWTYDGEIAGTTGQDKHMEAVRFKLLNPPTGYQVQYRVYVEGVGWTSVVSDGQIAGTVGQSKPIAAIEINLIRP